MVLSLTLMTPYRANVDARQQQHDAWAESEPSKVCHNTHFLAEPHCQKELIDGNSITIMCAGYEGKRRQRAGHSLDMMCCRSPFNVQDRESSTTISCTSLYSSTYNLSGRGYTCSLRLRRKSHVENSPPNTRVL